MSACLIQQLFRQKIGLELDTNIVEGTLFHLLRPHKHWPKELLTDVRLSHNAVARWIKDARLIVVQFHSRGSGTSRGRLELFSRGLLDAWIWHDPKPNSEPLTPSRSDIFIDGRQRYPDYRSKGMITSSHRRQCIPIYEWGGVDFMNEFRKPVSYHLPLSDPSMRQLYLNHA